MWGRDWYKYIFILSRCILGKSRICIGDLGISSFKTTHEHILLGKTSHALRHTYPSLKITSLSDPYLAWPDPVQDFCTLGSQSLREGPSKSLKEGLGMQTELPQPLFGARWWEACSQAGVHRRACPLAATQQDLRRSSGRLLVNKLVPRPETRGWVLQTHKPAEAGREQENERLWALDRWGVGVGVSCLTQGGGRTQLQPSIARSSRVQGKTKTCIFTWNLPICKCRQLNQDFYKTLRQYKSSLIHGCWLAISAQRPQGVVFVCREQRGS